MAKNNKKIEEVVETSEVIEEASDCRTIIVGDEQHTYKGDKLICVIDSQGNLKEMV